MRKMLSMMLIMASFVCFTACLEDDEDGHNALQGTVWKYSNEIEGIFGYSSSYTHYIEFVDATTVKVWDTSHGPYKGSYYVKDNKVYFSGLVDTYWKKEYKNGIFSSRTLTVTSQCTITELTYEDTYIKD